MIRFEVPGNPKGKARPRFAREGRGVRTYTPDSTVAYEHEIKLRAQIAGIRLIDGPVMLHVVAVREIPASASAATRNALQGKPCDVKPDWDNIGKAVSDALNGVAYRDDSQVVHVTVEKRWGDEGKLIILIDEYQACEISGSVAA